jgi:SAM-dependent methyltransferase
MEEKRFNPGKLERLNDPERLKEFPVEYVIDLTGITNPEVLIDIGAGTAFFSIPFAKRYKSCRIYACDISEIMIEWMTKNIFPDYPHIIPLQLTDHQVPLEDNVADLIFMVNLHHELDNPEDTLNECYRLLKPGGSIAISDWRKETTDKGPSVNLRYEPEEVKKQLQKSGFQKVEYYTHFPHNFLVVAKKSTSIH